MKKQVQNDSQKAIASTGGGGYSFGGHAKEMGGKIQGMVSPGARAAAAKNPKKVGMATAFKPIGKSFPCPHCDEGISKLYAVKALTMIAKSEGLDLEDDLHALLNDVEKADPSCKSTSPVKGETGYVGNKKISTAGSKKKGHLSSTRGHGTGQEVQRHNTPTNPTSEDGMAKSLRLPVIVGDSQIVQYGYGMDNAVADSIQKGWNHEAPMQNFRKEREEFTGELEE